MAEAIAPRLATLRGPDPCHVARSTLTIAAVLVLYALAPLYDGTFFLSFLIDVLILGLAALGLQHIVGDAGVLNLGQAAFFGLGAYGGVWTLQHWGWSTLPAFAAAIAVALAGAVLMAPLLRLRGVYFAMASFAFGAMMFEIYSQAVSITGGENALFLIPPPEILCHTFVGNRDTYLPSSLSHSSATPSSPSCRAARTRSRSTLSVRARTSARVRRQRRATSVPRARARVIPAALAGVLYAQVHCIVQSTIFYYNQSVSLITIVIIGAFQAAERIRRRTRRAVPRRLPPVYRLLSVPPLLRADRSADDRAPARYRQRRGPSTRRPTPVRATP